MPFKNNLILFIVLALSIAFIIGFCIYAPTKPIISDDILLSSDIRAENK